jgi:hypothetical protein
MALRIDFDQPATLFAAFPAGFADVRLDVVGHRIDLEMPTHPLVTDRFEMEVSIHRGQSQEGGTPLMTLSHPPSKIITKLGCSLFPTPWVWKSLRTPFGETIFIQPNSGSETEN